MGRGAAPMELRMFLLATGERGLGYEAVFGRRQLTISEFELYSYIQSRVMMLNSEEGKKDLELEVGVREAIRLENGVELPPEYGIAKDFAAEPESVDIAALARQMNSL